MSQSKGAAKVIPVYRQFQPFLTSPCMLAAPCEVCRQHAPAPDGTPCRCKNCSRGKTECPLAVPAEPAFRVNMRDALALIHNGLARFVNRSTALCLTFSKISQLRDRSLKVDENFLMRYAAGGKREREIIDGQGDSWMRSSHMASRNTRTDWRLIRKVNSSDLDKIGAEPERIQSFS
jgi:hypothetical protein